MNHFSEQLKNREDQGLLRKTNHLKVPPRAMINIDKKQFQNFISNNYLDLATDPRLIQASVNGAQKWGTGSTGSRLLGGSLDYHSELETELAQAKSYESSLLFNSGYNANIGIMQALVEKGAHIYSDQLNHASMVDGIKLSQGVLHRYRHCDVDHLQDLIKKYGGPGIILSEAIFSMDGDAAPLKELQVLAQENGLLLAIDEAHSDGVFGPKGLGLCHLENIKPDILMGTFGKAYGCFGAHVCCSTEIREMMVNYSRSLIYTTALPASVTESVRCAFRIVQTEEWRRKRVLTNAEFLRTKLKDLGLNTLNSVSPIIPVILGDNQSTLKASSFLQEKGFLVAAIRHPTVPKGSARLRINLTAGHQKEHLNNLLEVLSLL